MVVRLHGVPRGLATPTVVIKRVVTHRLQIFADDRFEAFRDHRISPDCSSQCDLRFHNFFETVVANCKAEVFTDSLHPIVFR